MIQPTGKQFRTHAFTVLEKCCHPSDSYIKEREKENTKDFNSKAATEQAMHRLFNKDR